MHQGEGPPGCHHTISISDMKEKEDRERGGEISEHLPTQPLRTRKGTGYPKITKVRMEDRINHIRVLNMKKNVIIQ